MSSDTTSYALGYSEEELKRLGTQAEVIDPIFGRTLSLAGIAPGMRVLDVGCGPGYVSALLASMVGPSGEIVGVDISPSAVALARSRMSDLGLKNVSFLEGDPSAMSFDRPFDAVVGRYILMYLPDPAAMLRALASFLKPGGLLVFHEVTWGDARSHPPAPLYDACCRWLIAAVTSRNADMEMGMKMASAFVSAGLPSPMMRNETQMGSSESAYETVRLIVDLVRTQVDNIVACGAASVSEIRSDTLMDRVMAEIIANGSTVVGRGEAGAWVRRP